MFKDTFCMTFSLPQSSKKTFSSSLRENGLRPTKQRACVYRVILGKREPSYCRRYLRQGRKHLPGTSFATVYNCLETLVGCGLVRQVNLDRSPTRYCPNLTPHAHFKCIKSGKIYDVQIDEDTLSRMHSLVPEGLRQKT